MPRPRCPRRIRGNPESAYFKPRGIPLIDLDEIILTIDEFEAIRLADFEGLYQEGAAEKMQISRQTFGRIVESAHKKIADVLVNGKALRIEGGIIKMASERKFKCYDCGHEWQVPHGTGRPNVCPKCGSKNIHRSEDDRGHARGNRQGGGSGQGRRGCGGMSRGDSGGDSGRGPGRGRGGV